MLSPVQQRLDHLAVGEQVLVEAVMQGRGHGAGIVASGV